MSNTTHGTISHLVARLLSYSRTQGYQKPSLPENKEQVDQSNVSDLGLSPETRDTVC